mgnify:FL=1
MAWIESHSVLIDHRKTREVAAILNIKPVYLLGHIHCLWHKVIELAEDGDITAWTEADIAYYSKWDGDQTVFSNALNGRFIDVLDDGIILIHDWLDYAGLFLTRKYSSGNIEKLKKIWKKHGCKYGKGKGKYNKKQANSKRTKSEQKLKLPNQPNQPNQPNLNTYSTFFNDFWKEYPERNGKKLLKAEAERLFAKIKDGDIELIMQAVRNYANSKGCRNGYAKDAVRFLRNNFWRDWLEPEKKQPLPEFKNQALVEKLKQEGRL